MSGITQLVAVGAQDVYLMGDPQVSFFRTNFKRHTNFAQSVEEQLLEGEPADNGMSGVRVERKGDMLSYMYITALSGSTIVEPDWESVIDKVELYVGGQLIDSHDSLFSSEVLPQTDANQLSRSRLGPIDNLVTSCAFYPLRFFFGENWSSALPLVGLQYQDVEIRIHWGTVGSNRYQVWANFIYLDDNERKHMAEETQDLLITQVQSTTVTANKIIELNFNHPVKYLAMHDSGPAVVSKSNKVKLSFNGNDVAAFKHCDPHFTDVPNYYNCPNWATQAAANNPNLFVYPFCLDTSKFQPSGTLNFSRLDNSAIHSEIDFETGDKIYAVNYNIMRIQKGMGGLLYAN